MRGLLTIPLLAFALAGHAEYDWRAAGGEVVLEFNTGMLEPLGIEVEAVGALSVKPPPAPLGYSRLRFAGTGADTLRIDAPRLSVEAFSGRLSYRGGVVLKSRGRSADLTGFGLVPRDDHPFEFDLVDSDGTPWFRLDHVHYELIDGGEALELRHMNLTMLEAVEAFTEMPGVAGQIVGVAHARAPVSERPPHQAPLGQCADPNWATEPGFDNGVTLIALENASFMRCQDCNGADGGPVVFAPSARLKNEGTADVPWWHQFTGTNPPYGNDQHPFLIWNLYRVDGDGRLEQIAASGLKHAFFSTNTNCPCAGGNILWTDCEDTYSAANNDSASHLAPRSEIVPAAGLWGRCHSFFDPDCIGEQTQDSGLDSHLNRLNVLEADIDPAGNPDATYIMEAWYVVRDNSDIFGAMGWREFEASWNGSIWSAGLTGDFVQDPYIDTWVDPESAAPGEMNATADTPHGRIKVAVRTEDLGGGRWRYDYAVANFDFMQAFVRGEAPDSRIDPNIGLIEVRVPAADNVDIDDIESARADRTGGQDWIGIHQGGAVAWRNPGDTPLDWGLLFRFSLTADTAPAPATMTLQPRFILHDRFEPEAAQAPAIHVEILAPGPATR